MREGPQFEFFSKARRGVTYVVDLGVNRPRSEKSDLGTGKTGKWTSWVVWPRLGSGGQESSWSCQVTWILCIWQGTIGGAEGDRGWQRPTGSLRCWGTVAGETAARKLGRGQPELSWTCLDGQGNWAHTSVRGTRYRNQLPRGKGAPWA